MALIAESPATIGDTESCPTCGHVKQPAVRLHEIACCGLDSHVVHADFLIVRLSYALAHLWRDTNEYSAVESDREISEADALAWLERAHAGEVPRRPYEVGALVICDRWEALTWR